MFSKRGWHFCQPLFLKNQKITFKNLYLCGEMKILLKNLKIFQPESHYHLQNKDILVEDGIINAIENEISDTDCVVKEYAGAYLSLGWIDTHAPLTFPGDERRETLESLSLAAKAGGITDIICMPTPLSPIDTPEALISLKALSKNLYSRFHFVAAVTHQLNGKDLTEIGLLAQAGAIAFSNGNSPITDPQLLIRILQYLQPFGLPFIINPHLPFFNDGQVNDSRIALELGFKGIPKISETLTIVQTLEILKYIPAKVHFSPITTTEGWELIKTAKNKGFSITADIASNYLYFNDKDCLNYNTLAKVFPPYRDTQNQKQLLNYSNDYQGIASLHYPVIAEDKQLELGIAEPGIIHLQTSVPCFAKFVPLEKLITTLTYKPYQLFPILKNELKVGSKARFTIFTMEKWTFQKENNWSLSYNSPYFGHTFDFKIIDTIV